MPTLPEILAQTDLYERALPALPPPLAPPEGINLAAWIDHTQLRPEATSAGIKTLCDEARRWQFATVCVNPIYVPLARGLLRDSSVGICAVIAFPLGATLPEDKVYEARRVIGNGATEVDMVINLGALRGEAYNLVLNDILFVAREVHDLGKKLKVIIEAALLTRREKILACLFAKTAGADFVKTSTGFGPGGARRQDVDLMRRVVGSDLGVKAAGGIRTVQEALDMIAAGADRIGTSAGVAIMNQIMGAPQ